jgi:hypothetical protein
VHYGVPEGSYSTAPDSPMRILEFREMVQVRPTAGWNCDIASFCCNMFSLGPCAALDAVSSRFLGSQQTLQCRLHRNSNWDPADSATGCHQHCADWDAQWQHQPSMRAHSDVAHTPEVPVLVNCWLS